MCLESRIVVWIRSWIAHINVCKICSLTKHKTINVGCLLDYIGFEYITHIVLFVCLCVSVTVWIWAGGGQAFCQNIYFVFF